MRGLGSLVLSRAAPAGAPGAAVSDRVREENARVRASIGQSDDSFTRLPFDIDRDADQRCMETHGYPL